MLKTMKRPVAFWMAIGAVALLSTGCPGDKIIETEPTHYKLTGTIEDMPSNREYVLKVVSYRDDDDDKGVILADAAISPDGSFSVNVPDDMAPEYLMPYNESSDWTYGLPHDGVTVTDGNARFSATCMEVYAGAEYVGEVYYGTEGEDFHVDGFFFYSNADCDISGGYHNTDIEADVTYGISAKSGWNWAFGTEKEGAEGTEMILASPKPSGVRFYYEPSY